jgi:CheY-like chemotaxis protein
VAQSGGELRIASAAGEGTTVALWLPADTGMRGLTGAGAQVGAEVAASPAETPVEAKPGRLTVLVVDDNALLLNATERLLKTLHHDVLCAPDAQTAFDLVCCRDEIGLVLSDVSMLGESGAELAERLAVLRPELPVILMTGYAWDVPPAIGRTVLVKPFTRPQLVAAIHQARHAG